MKCPVLLVVLTAFSLSRVAVADSGWPTSRHDPQLTGFSPLKGGFERPPREACSIDLGAKPRSREHVRLGDIDGDGLAEILLVREDRIVCMGRRGETLWETEPMPKPRITDIADFAGNGTRGLLAWSDSGLERDRYIISGKTGKAARLYAMKNIFGAEERIGRILADVAGQQIGAWWSGEHQSGHGGEQIAQGRIFSFENGVEAPVTRFSTEIIGLIFSPKHFFADYDQDGQKEMAVVSHQQVWLYDIATNRLELEIRWPMIRTYSASLAMLPTKPGSKPSLLSINPHIPGVERVDIVDGKAVVTWKQVVGRKEDQYQNLVKIAAGAPDPFLHLAGDGRLFVLASVTNERNDGETYLAIFDGDTGARVFEEKSVQALCSDDLDGDGVPELLLKQNGALRIADWKDGKLLDRWQGTGVEPLLVPAPSEGDLARNLGVGNTPVWREVKGGNRFLLKFPDGVFACQLTANGFAKRERITVHEALGNAPDPNPSVEIVAKDEGFVVVKKGESEVFRYEIRKAPTYLAPPAVVGDLGGERRVLVLDAEGALLSFSRRGDDRRLLAGTVVGSEWSICDVDGDGENEVVTAVADAQGRPSCVFLDAGGAIKRRIGLIDNAKSLKVGPTGRIGSGKGRWVVIYYEMNTGSRNGVVAYNGATGEEMWRRDHYERRNESQEGAETKFVLHIPTAVYDHDGDGSDDLLAASENFYGIVSVAANRDLTTPVVFSDYIPGHWQAYARPIVVNALGKDRPHVFHHQAFAQTILTDLEGNPIWHWGMTRDETASAWPGIGDLDGDGTLEIAQTRADGLIRVFDARPTNQPCPRCSSNQELTANNHGGRIRWEATWPPPISDIAACDLDNDGRAEFLFGSGDGNLYAIGEREGKPLLKWSKPFGRTVGSPVIADLEQDACPEILAPIEDGRVILLRSADSVQRP